MIAVDVMGGDLGPQVALRGAVVAARQGYGVALFGPEEELKKLLQAEAPDWQDLPIKIFHASQTVLMTDEPTSVIRHKRQSSLVKAMESLAAGDAFAVVSTGNSGALMVAATFVLGREEGVDRPAIAGFFP